MRTSTTRRTKANTPDYDRPTSAPDGRRYWVDANGMSIHLASAPDDGSNLGLSDNVTHSLLGYATVFAARCAMHELLTVQIPRHGSCPVRPGYPAPRWSR